MSPHQETVSAFIFFEKKKLINFQLTESKY